MHVPTTLLSGGRMTEEGGKQLAREAALGRLRAVARPDHRHHWDLAEFIADFKGSAEATAHVTALDAYRAAHVVFVTPDNGLRHLREQVLRDGKRLLVSTCGIGRGFLGVDGKKLTGEQIVLASTMEGADELATPLTLAVIARDWQPTLLVTGAFAVTPGGLRLGKGRGYFDLEWAMLCTVGATQRDATVVTLVHDVQVIEEQFPTVDHDVVSDWIVTPSAATATGRSGSRSGTIEWERLSAEKIAATPPLQELAR